jgi:hypothetical protein
VALHRKAQFAKQLPASGKGSANGSGRKKARGAPAKGRRPHAKKDAKKKPGKSRRR